MASLRRAVEMADYRIVCTSRQPASQGALHDHIVGVRVEMPSDGPEKWLSLQQVLQMLDGGDRFFTVGPQTQKKAWVEEYQCPRCGQEHIKSGGDFAIDNNLDDLPRC